MKMTIQSFFKNIFESFKRQNNELSYKSIYRVVEIFKNEDQEHTVLIQVINTRTTFYIKPEELLADDNLVKLFFAFRCKNINLFRISRY